MLQAHQLSYRYPSAATDAVHPTDLQFERGTFTVLTGPTGCGKSTLLRLLAGLLQRHGGGTFGGSITWNGSAVDQMSPSERVRHLGFVAQNPDDQLIAGTLGDEIAFAAESAGVVAAEIDASIGPLLARLGLPAEPDRDVRALSGGQRQRLVVAAALSGGGQALLLDEPLAHLDPNGAAELVRHLRELANEGRTIIAVEHRLEAVYTACDRMVVMEQGRVVLDKQKAAVKSDSLRRLGLIVPVDVELSENENNEAFAAIRVWRFERPVGGRATRISSERASFPDLSHQAAEGAEPQSKGAGSLGVPCPPVLWTKPVSFGYERGEKVLDVGAFSFFPGERVAIVGPNGAGKSTLLGVMTGEFGPAISTCIGRVVSVPQDPDLSLFCTSVRDELAYAPRDLGISGSISDLAAAFSLADLLDRAPQALSRGQRLRTAVAAAMAAKPSVLSLDEPTAGQDFDQVERLMEALRGTMSAGVLLFATHDLGLAIRHATRIIVLSKGQLMADGHPAETLDRRDVAALLPLPGALGRCRDLGISLAELGRRGELFCPVNVLRERAR